MDQTFEIEMALAHAQGLQNMLVASDETALLLTSFQLFVLLTPIIERLQKALACCPVDTPVDSIGKA